jgi:hypothetical protein
MRVTEQIIDNEMVVRGWLTAERAWVTWHDDRAKRERSTPTLIALHIPSRLVIAIYARPRKLRPSEAPDVSWLPASCSGPPRGGACSRSPPRGSGIA